MPRMLLGSGLLPEAPMSPPAQLTRISTSPNLPSTSARIAATASRSPILPVTPMVRVPRTSNSLITAPRSDASPYLPVASQLRSCSTRSAPRAASLRAMAWPSPRPEPVTNAILPARSLAIQFSLHQSEGLQVGGGAPDLGQFV